MLKYGILGEHQLLNIAQEGGIHDKKLNAEWKRRYGMNLPYKLNIHNQIYNCLMDTVISDEQADKLILEQAERLRKRGA